MKRKKCIIIGSGLGGLSCGVILAINGYDVTVLEQHSRIGGCLQCFSRGGARFETGMHFIGSALPGQTLDRLMRYLRLDDIRLSRLDPKAYDIVAFGSDRYRFANGREPFIEQMADYFPHEKDNIARYFDIIESVAQGSSLHSLRYADNDLMLDAHYQTISIDAVLDSLFTDQRLKDVLVGNLPLYAAEKGKTPFSQHAFIMDFYNQSAFRIAGGSDSIAESLAATIRRHGGEVRVGCQVSNIECDAEKATGVTTDKGEFLAADIVITAIHPKRVMEMLDTKMIRPAFKKRMMNLKNTTAGFSLYLKFKKDRVDYLNSNFYSFNSGSPWGCESYTDANWPKGYLYMHFCDSDAPRHASSGVILSYMNIRDVERWKDLPLGRRGDDYEEFKRRKAETLLDAVEKDFPGFRDGVETYYTATPLTYVDYTGTPDGSMYGVAKDITLGSACRVPQRTKVPNLLLTGQNINSHGMLGVIVGSIVTCSELFTSKTIYQQITDIDR
ncbi:MAG: NAD(P)/FAD-dependent oxidoreductase [Muribaculaceae bacterium]|nr:NAD(P)/FAD-dependent oxidoreductase [Muribaculaceae bacterium]